MKNLALEPGRMATPVPVSLCGFQRDVLPDLWRKVGPSTVALVTYRTVTGLRRGSHHPRPDLQVDVYARAAETAGELTPTQVQASSQNSTELMAGEGYDLVFVYLGRTCRTAPFELAKKLHVRGTEVWIVTCFHNADMTTDWVNAIANLALGGVIMVDDCGGQDGLRAIYDCLCDRA